MTTIKINGAAVDAAGTGSMSEAKMAAYYDNLIYAGTRNLVEHTDYPKLADIRRGLRTDRLAIPRIHLIAIGILPEHYPSWNDFVDAYLYHEYGWQHTTR